MQKIIEPLQRFLGVFKHVGRTVSANTWSSIASLKFAPQDLCPHFVISILMALAASPTPNLILSNEIKSMMRADKIQNMKECEEIIKKAISICTDMKISKAVETKQLGELRTSLIFKFFDKVKELKEKTHAQLASEFFSNIVGHAHPDSEVANPWADQAKTPSQTSDEVPKVVDDHRHSTHVVEYGDDGKAVGVHRHLVFQKGFTENSNIKMKKTGVPYHVGSLENQIKC